MTDYLSIGEAAKAVHTTSETLRHYDRIGLVKPSKKDEWTNYRYYTQQDLVRLNTVRALQLMGLPLQEIKNVMEYDDLEKIVEFLAQAERKADEKIAAFENLWNYLGHFYDKLPLALKEKFSFEDLAGIYTENGRARLFAVCTRYEDTAGLKKLPKGKYLCASCTEENRARTLEELAGIARAKYGAEPDFTEQLIVVSGILQWTYEAQVYVGE